MVIDAEYIVTGIVVLLIICATALLIPIFIKTKGYVDFDTPDGVTLARKCIKQAAFDTVAEEYEKAGLEYRKGRAFYGDYKAYSAMRYEKFLDIVLRDEGRVCAAFRKTAGQKVRKKDVLPKMKQFIENTVSMNGGMTPDELRCVVTEARSKIERVTATSEMRRIADNTDKKMDDILDKYFPTKKDR